MNNKMKIAFFGTSDRSNPILEALKKSEFELDLCITKADVLIGRNQDVKENGVKTWCVANRVDFVSINKLDSLSKVQIQNEIINRDIKIGIVADFSFIISEDIFNLFEYGIVNIHFSTLPYYRGASPVQFAILNGDKEVGISFQLIEKGMDTGPIIFQKKFPIESEETSQDIYDRLFVETSHILPIVIKDYIEGKLIPRRQDETQANYTYSKTNPKTTLILKDDAKIDWAQTVEQIHRTIKAFYPWPVAWTTLEDLSKHYKKVKENKDKSLRVKIYKANLENSELKIKQVQVEGKQIMDWESFKNGYLN
jgi:methionyl-tRNA formyltransferase